MEGSCRTVLIVEDDVEIASALEDVLRDNGREPVCAHDGAEALAWLRANPAPSLILLDMSMPILDGPGFRAVQREDPALAQIPVVILSAFAPSRTATALAGVDWLEKPIRLDALLGVVARYSEAASSQPRKGRGRGPGPQSSSG